MMHFRAPFAAALLMVLTGCASTAETPQVAPPISGPQSVCSVDNAQKANRLPTPKQPGCAAAADVAADERACAAGEADACYRHAFCVAGQWVGAEPSDERTAAVDGMKTRLGTACAAGITEACVLRAGVRIDAGEAESATCDDLVRACQLGDDVDGCVACLKSGCG